MDAVHTSLLAATPPYTLGASIRALSGFAPCAGDQRVNGGQIPKAFALSAERLAGPAQVPAHDERRLAGPAQVPAHDERRLAGPAQVPAHDEAVVAEVAPRPDAEPGVALRVFARRELSGAEIARVQRQVSRWLSLDDDLAPFLAVARRDPAMRPILAATHGLHQVRFASLAEATVYFTLTQRSTQWFAAARKRRIAAELGPRLTVDGTEYVAFPDFPALAEVDFDGYAGNPARGRRVAEVVAGVAALDEEWLRTAPFPEARDALLHVRGIGTFTGHALLLRALRRPDAVPLEMAQFTGVARAAHCGE